MQKRINWIELGRHLAGVGINSAHAAELCQSSQPVVFKIFTGHTRNPAYPLGQALVDLFMQRCAGVDVPELPPAQPNIAQAATETVANIGD